MFELLHKTPATLTTFTGRVETHGKEKVPAVSFRLKFTGPNTLLDLLSPDVRRTLYKAADGQEDLPGVEPSTPLLRSKDINRWSPENAYEGWTVTLEHGIDDAGDLEMGLAKIDAFSCSLYDGGTVNIECRVSTSDIDAAGAGLLWSKQQSPVSVMFAAPLTPSTNPEAGEVDERQMTLDGTTGGEKREPSAARRAADEAFEPGSEGMDPLDPTDVFLGQHAENQAGDEGDDE